jgi:hypothetical protein
MLAKLTLTVVLFGALAVPGALASGGPLFAVVGGAGVLSGPTRFVPVVNNSGNDTTLEAISSKDGTVGGTLDLVGQWGVPSTPSGAEGLSLDGKRLVLTGVADGQASPSLFLVVNPKTMRIVRPITLPGVFSYDAMSPDASRLYFIQYKNTDGLAGATSHYVVRAYDLRMNRLLPGRVADRTQKSWVMEGYPVTRTASAGGRWVYTLYTNPAGYPFIHALDTVRGVAHCVGLPMRNQNGIYNMRLALHGRNLSVHWLSGRPFVNVDTATWKVSPAHRGGFPWWTLAFLVVVPLALLVRSRGRSSRLEHELSEILRDEAPEPELAA